jgi:hypothetical protein
VNLTAMSSWHVMRLVTGEGRADDRSWRIVELPETDGLPDVFKVNHPSYRITIPVLREDVQRPLLERGGREGHGRC